MNDLSGVLSPKSDQINASDLLSGDMTITIVSVKITPGTEQPVSVRFEGSDKVWRPCKTTGRILMAAWGPDTSVYPGRSVQLYLDPKVKWGGMEVGGIRVRALSHIEAEMKLALAESKQNRKMFTIKPLAAQKPAPSRAAVATDEAVRAEARETARKGSGAFRAWFKANPAKRPEAQAIMKDLQDIATDADARLAATDDDPFGLPPIDMPTPEDMARAESAALAEIERQNRENNQEGALA
jgi:hypothetical protein